MLLKEKSLELIICLPYERYNKGGTVYVDGSRDSQVLSLTKDDNEESWNDFDSKEDLSKPKLEDDSEGTLRKEKYQITKEKQDEVFSHIRADRLDREIGVEVGNICPICLEGQVENLGGCNTCTNCGAQLACDA